VDTVDALVLTGSVTDRGARGALGAGTGAATAGAVETTGAVEAAATISGVGTLADAPATSIGGSANTT
jgi:hypothetical protein